MYVYRLFVGDPGSSGTILSGVPIRHVESHDMRAGPGCPQLYTGAADIVFDKSVSICHLEMPLKEGTVKILIVDDSLVVRTIIENAVKPIGYDVVHAANGKEALDVLATRAKEVELILLDWNMPIQDGYETVKQIKKNKAYDHICILMVSTESEDEKIDQALAAGAHGYLAKPFSAEELAEKVQATLKKFKSGR